MPFDSIDRPRDEDGFTFWSADVSRMLACGDYGSAIATLVETGHGYQEAERFVAVSLAINTPRPLNGHLTRLRALVDVARREMLLPGWSFAAVAAALEEAQLGLSA